jgi:hypothetical protein
MRHEFTKGTKLDTNELERLHAQLDRQRVRADQLVETLREKRSRSFDFIADTRSLQMAPVPDEIAADLPQIEEVQRLEGRKPKVAIMPTNQDDEWFVNFGPLAANANAHEQVSQKTPIGSRYYKHMLATDPELLCANVNRWWQRQPQKRMVRAEMTPENGHKPLGFARAFLSNSYRRLDNLEVCDAMLPMLTDADSPWNITQAGITDIAVHIEAKAPTVCGEVRVGEPVMLAVKIQTGEVGNRALTAQAGMYTLKCSNLLMVPSWCQRQVHLGRAENEFVELLSEATLRKEDQLVIDKMRDVVAAMHDVERFAALLATAQASADRDQAGLKSPVHATQLLARDAQLTEAEGVLVWNEMMKEGDPTIWGLTSALTATSRGLEFERKAQLEAVAGKVLNGKEAWARYTTAAA